jgi:hypothetical protein
MGDFELLILFLYFRLRILGNKSFSLTFLMDTRIGKTSNWNEYEFPSVENRLTKGLTSAFKEEAMKLDLEKIDPCWILVINGYRNFIGSIYP